MISQNFIHLRKALDENKYFKDSSLERVKYHQNKMADSGICSVMSLRYMSEMMKLDRHGEGAGFNY